MKLNKALICVTAVAAMMLVRYSAPAQVILSTLDLSGKVIVNTNDSVLKGGKDVLTPIKASFKTKDLINSLNDSAPFLSYLTNWSKGGLRSLPTDTTFGYDIYGNRIYLILPTGGRIPLYDVYVPYYGGDYTFADMSRSGPMSAKYSYDDATGKGSETDQFSNWYMSFNNQEEGPDYLYLQMQGQMEVKWKAGAVSSGYRELSVKCSFTGSGYLNIFDSYGTLTSKAKGKGSETSVGDTYWPYWEY